MHTHTYICKIINEMYKYTFMRVRMFHVFLSKILVVIVTYVPDKPLMGKQSRYSIQKFIDLEKCEKCRLSNVFLI